MTIHLVGPGGAGKSTIGVLLADRLNRRFFDLDRCFVESEGDISDYMQHRGYEAYARQNVEVYCSIGAAEGGVMALSSGFMTYSEEVHPSYVETQTAIAESSTTFVLLPSLDEETCVAEIVRRQVQRPLGLLASREEAKIRKRFSIYMALQALKVETMRSPDEVVMEIADALPPNSALHPSTHHARGGPALGPLGAAARPG
jgi:shikimate kinase